MGLYVITGTASGIGSAVRKRLQVRGDEVIGVDLRDADLIADLSTSEGRKSVADSLTAHVGRIDGFCTCAGITPPHEDPATMVSVNFFGMRDLLETVRPLMALSGRAYAVAVSSNAPVVFPSVPRELIECLLAGHEARSRRLAATAGDMAAYAASKLAIQRWVRLSATSPEWAGQGIRLNSVAPGGTKTPAFDRAVGTMDLDDSVVPIGRWAEPDEIARAIEFFLSPAADYVVGQVLFADAGSEARSCAEVWPIAPLHGAQ